MTDAFYTEFESFFQGQVHRGLKRLGKVSCTSRLETSIGQQLRQIVPRRAHTSHGSP